jgi:hypothetical protein
MSRYCHIQNCDAPAVICVRGHWYCFQHKPVMFTDEDVRLHGVK